MGGRILEAFRSAGSHRSECIQVHFPPSDDPAGPLSGGTDCEHMTVRRSGPSESKDRPPRIPNPFFHTKPTGLRRGPPFRHLHELGFVARNEVAAHACKWRQKMLRKPGWLEQGRTGGCSTHQPSSHRGAHPLWRHYDVACCNPMFAPLPAECAARIQH